MYLYLYNIQVHPHKNVAILAQVDVNGSEEGYLATTLIQVIHTIYTIISSVRFGARRLCSAALLEQHGRSRRVAAAVRRLLGRLIALGLGSQIYVYRFLVLGGVYGTCSPVEWI